MTVSAHLRALPVDPGKLVKAVGLLAQLDFGKMVAAFKNADLLGELQTVDDLLKILAIFIQPLAIPAQDLQDVIDVVEFLGPLVLPIIKSSTTNALVEQQQLTQERFQGGMNR